MSGKKNIEQFKCIVNIFEIGRFYRTFADLSLGLELLIDWLLFDVNIALCRLFLWRWEFFLQNSIFPAEISRHTDQLIFAENINTIRFSFIFALHSGK